MTDSLVKLRDNKLIQTIPIKDFVAAISVGIVNQEQWLDLTYKEDSRAEVDMNVVMTGGGEFIEIQGTAEKSPFNKQQMDKLLELAKAGIQNLIDSQRKLLKDVL